MNNALVAAPATVPASNAIVPAAMNNALVAAPGTNNALGGNVTMTNNSVVPASSSMTVVRFSGTNRVHNASPVRANQAAGMDNTAVVPASPTVGNNTQEEALQGQVAVGYYPRTNNTAVAKLPTVGNNTQQETLQGQVAVGYGTNTEQGFVRSNWQKPYSPPKETSLSKESIDLPPAATPETECTKRDDSTANRDDETVATGYHTPVEDTRKRGRKKTGRSTGAAATETEMVEIRRPLRRSARKRKTVKKM